MKISRQDLKSKIFNQAYSPNTFNSILYQRGLGKLSSYYKKYEFFEKEKDFAEKAYYDLDEVEAWLEKQSWMPVGKYDTLREAIKEYRKEHG